ncbi:Hcp family type VI secretion system effector [Roseibacillus persicicus]|uniref:Hcp family type VI secretion system effector n=1 Tax=Roseibacillus persicicus TaxID=454148 RepID=UPI0028102AE0|nr:type VI secretion system tube protein Hcp [Roseibacillus persicicus]MDQ8189773.1 type VI secretion system tube protein Hcp [Roseibacillus persicicus]
MNKENKTIWSALGWLAVVAALLLPLVTVSGAVDIFLRVHGIDGESDDKSHKDEIDVLAWSWGMSNSGTTHTSGPSAGKATFKDLTVTKYVDKSSPPLMLKAIKSERIDNATLVVRKAGEAPLEYITLDLKDIIVSSITTGGSGGEDRLTENVTFNFSKFKLTYQEQPSDGSPGDTEEIDWDIVANKEGNF